MTTAFRISSLALVLALCGCDVHWMPKGCGSCVRGDTPSEVASSITFMRSTLSGEKKERFESALNTLMLVSPDKDDERAIGNLTPQFARMIHGRDVDQIIQLADLYRGSVPMDHP